MGNRSRDARPSDVAVVLATALEGGSTGWAWSGAIAQRLRRFGFETTSSQAAAYLQRMVQLECPPIYVARGTAASMYCVTSFGKIWVKNVLGVELSGEFRHPVEIAAELAADAGDARDLPA